MSLYGQYDNFYSNNPTPCVLGGTNRSKNAQRDSQGRFMPTNVTYDWKSDPEHGKKGGRVRAKTALRINGKFAKKVS